MSTSKELLVAMTKEFGNVVQKGVVNVDTARIQTGIFAFDMAVGGGIPKGRISILYGPESSLKTTIALRTIAESQRSEPDKVCVFVDVENSYDPEWGAAHGVDNTKLIYVRPDYAEQVVDIVEAFLLSDDIAVVVLDSLAALTTRNETESSADKAVVGGAGLVVGKLYRKVTLALSKAAREGIYPSFIVINQVRMKIGVLYGNPEVMPGGKAFVYGSSLTVRLYGKDEVDKAVSSVMPAWKICTGIIQKYKVPILARTFEFKMASIPNITKKLALGGVYDWPTVLSYLKNTDYFGKSQNGWSLDGVEYLKQDDIRAALSDDPAYGVKVKDKLISDALEKAANGE